MKRALVSKKEISDYHLISDKNKVYINNTYYPQLMGSSEGPKATLIDQKEIPRQIKNVQLYVKSETELREIADKTGDFLYLTLGYIEIDGDTAKIGLSNNWVVSKKNKGKYALMSGGGYILTFKKVNGKWIYDEEATHRIWQG